MVKVVLIKAICFQSNPLLTVGTEEIMALSGFDTIFTKSVPHILENIFFSLDYKSYKNCMKVCIAWNDLLTSDSFRRCGKSLFREDIDKELRRAVREGDEDEVRKILDSGMTDVNSLGILNQSFLYAAVCSDHLDVVKVLLDEGADPNMGLGSHVIEKYLKRIPPPQVTQYSWNFKKRKNDVI